MRPLSLAIAISISLLVAGGAYAKAPQCKDASGKFIKCPAAAAATTPAAPPKVVRCKDAKGKFIKCPTAGATTTTTTTSVSAPPTRSTTTTTTTTTTVPRGSSVGAPAGATAKCKDGTYSMSKTHSGSCSHHGGVAAWL